MKSLKRRAAVLALLGLSLLSLGACATAPNAGPGLKANPGSSEPAPLSRQDADWFFARARAGGEPAKLAYGRPESDDVNLMLWCASPRRMVLAAPVWGDDETLQRLVLRSGQVSLRLDLADSDYGLVADIGLDAPLLAAFKATGSLVMIVDHHPPVALNAASDAGRTQIQNFFQACR